MTMTGEEIPEPLRRSEMRTGGIKWCLKSDFERWYGDGEIMIWLWECSWPLPLIRLTWATWGRDNKILDSWHAPLRQLKADLILRAHLPMSMNADLLSLTMSCADAELWCRRLSEPYLITMKADQCLTDSLSTWSVVSLKEWAWLWALDCWAPQMLMLMLITWSWSPLTWPWGLMMADQSLMLSHLAMIVMPSEQDLQDEVMWWAPRHRMTVWPWNPWLSHLWSSWTLKEHWQKTLTLWHEELEEHDADWKAWTPHHWGSTNDADFRVHEALEVECVTWCPEVWCEQLDILWQVTHVHPRWWQWSHDGILDQWVRS